MIEPATAALVPDFQPAQIDRRLVQARLLADEATLSMRPVALQRARARVFGSAVPTGVDLPGPLRAATIASQDNRGAPWSPGEEAALHNAFTSGATIAQLASFHGRTDNAIRLRLVALGLMSSTAADQSQALKPNPW